MGKWTDRLGGRWRQQQAPGSAPPSPSVPPTHLPPLDPEATERWRDWPAEMVPGLEADYQRMLSQLEAESARIQAEVDDQDRARAERERAENAAYRALEERERFPRSPLRGPSWMSAEDWRALIRRYRAQGRSYAEIAQTAEYLDQRGPRKPWTREERLERSKDLDIVTRALYVPKEDEARFLTRDPEGLPTIKLVDAGDRLAIWSPIDGGELINPKGPGLRRFGLITSYARGGKHRPQAFIAADMRNGKPVELRREPDNPHDKNTVAMYAPSAAEPFAYVSKGRALAVARRMDAGEGMAGVCLVRHSHSGGAASDSVIVLLGSTRDLAALLD